MVIRNCERENRHKSLSWVTKLIIFIIWKFLQKILQKLTSHTHNVLSTSKLIVGIYVNFHVSSFVREHGYRKRSFCHVFVLFFFSFFAHDMLIDIWCQRRRMRNKISVFFSVSRKSKSTHCLWRCSVVEATVSNEI